MEVGYYRPILVQSSVDALPVSPEYQTDLKQLPAKADRGGHLVALERRAAFCGTGFLGNLRSSQRQSRCWSVC
jgi:hypothetical protein